MERFSKTHPPPTPRLKPRLHSEPYPTPPPHPHPSTYPPTARRNPPRLSHTMQPLAAPLAAPPTLPFLNRSHAGRLLANALRTLPKAPAPLVLALPRGGVPVAFEVAQSLRAPLDVWIVRKLGMPGHEELALGAIAPGGTQLLNTALVHSEHIAPETIEALVAHETLEMKRRHLAYRACPDEPEVQGHSVFLIDDGIATGATVRAAIASIRPRNPRRLILAVPLASRSVWSTLQHEVDIAITLCTPEPFYAVGAWYRDFHQTTDREVVDLLHRNRHSLQKAPLPPS